MLDLRLARVCDEVVSFASIYWNPRGGIPIDVLWEVRRPHSLPDQGVAPFIAAADEGRFRVKRYRVASATARGWSAAIRKPTNSIALAKGSCSSVSVTEECDHAKSEERHPDDPQASALEERQADRGEASTAAQTCPVSPDETPDRRSRPDLCHRGAFRPHGVCMLRCQALRKISAIISESLERLPARWQAIHHVREKFSCRVCEAITETPAPSHPIARGPFLIAHILFCR